MASSTRTPITRESASRVTMLRLKPSHTIPAKAGITDSGKATADISVARHSRKNIQTTITASSAPSYSNLSELRYSSCTGVTKSNASVRTMCSWRCFSSLRASLTALPTTISLSPRLRATSKPTTGRPSRSAAERASPTISFTVATWSRRIRCTKSPLARDTDSSVAASSAALFALPRVRTDCSSPPIEVLPPELSVCMIRSCSEISAAVKPNALSFNGSSETRISRFTPPTRLTEPTPLTANKVRDIS